ncbi:mCG144818, partial [Mus musculus]
WLCKGPSWARNLKRSGDLTCAHSCLGTPGRPGVFVYLALWHSINSGCKQRLEDSRPRLPLGSCVLSVLEVDNNTEEKSLSRLPDKPDPDIPGPTIEDNDSISIIKACECRWDHHCCSEEPALNPQDTGTKGHHGTGAFLLREACPESSGHKKLGAAWNLSIPVSVSQSATMLHTQIAPGGSEPPNSAGRPVRARRTTTATQRNPPRTLRTQELRGCLGQESSGF